MPEKHPLRERSAIDTVCLWMTNGRGYYRLFCNRVDRDADGVLVVERILGKRRAVRRRVLDPLIMRTSL